MPLTFSFRDIKNVSMSELQITQRRFYYLYSKVNVKKGF